MRSGPTNRAWISRAIVARGGQLAAIALLSACTPATSRTASVAEARATFAIEQYCPADRVAATRVLALGAPPSAVARDPGRFALWRAIALRRAATDERQIVQVEGCGESAQYACWDFKGQVQGRRGAGEVTIGASCIDAAPDASTH